MNYLKSLLKRQASAKFFIIFTITLLVSGCTINEKKSLELFNPASYKEELISSSGSDSLFIKDGALVVNFSPGKYGSTIMIRPSDGVWDASEYRFVYCELENPGQEAQMVELGFGNYDLSLGGTLVPPNGRKILKAIIYRTEHPAYIDSIFPVMHGKPDGVLRGWMASTSDSIEYIKLIFPTAIAGDSIRIGKIWFGDPYILLTADELREKFYPFIDSFGQLIQSDWPGKIHNENDLVLWDMKEQEDLALHPKSPEWDKYGGWENGPELKATGRFRVEKYEGKWWFVDPEGKLFWSNGFDCVEFGRQSQTLVTGRESFFSFLPTEDSPGSALYASTGNENNIDKSLSFHTVNLHRKYGNDWKEKAHEQIHRRMHSWGFNTIGNWSDNEIYLKRKTPYVLTIYSKKTGEIADPYHPEFKDELLESLAAGREELDDPWCIGVFIDNELKWGVRWAPKIAEQIQEAPKDQPAKIAFRDRLIKKYKNIAALNTIWGTSYVDWDQLIKNRVVIPGAAPDMKEFMIEFTTLYHSVCRNAVKELSPQLLYMGSRMDFHLYPEDSSLNDIIKIAAKYCDVVSFNRYRYTCAELVPPEGGDYPLIIGEYHFGSLETGLLQPGLRYAADQEERAELFGHYLESALENPYIIGAHWFQLVDQAVSGRGDGENYQAGFLTVGDVPQEEMINKSREIGYNMYQRRNNTKLGQEPQNGFLAEPVFEFNGDIEPPVITQGDPGTEDNIYGFEGGRVLRLENEYHLFTTEMNGEPVWCKTRIAHWKSMDGKSWQRVSTLFESSGDFTGTDMHACLWSPMPTYDEKNNGWVMTYVCYRSKPNSSEGWFRNYDGRIAMASSVQKGKKGIQGPYLEDAIILEPDPADPKLGLMGVNSFFPFQVNGQWVAFYGSSTEWNGFAKSESLTGKWERIPEAGIVSQHTENPVVSRLPDGRYVAFFDGCGTYQKFGYMISSDGLHWSKPIIIDLDDQPGKWWGLSRTPLGLIDEGKGNYTLYFTAYNKNFYQIPGIWEAKSDSVFDGFFASIGMIRLKLVR